MNYYIDFDNTLYNTPLLKDAMLDAISSEIASEKKLDNTEILKQCSLMFNRENIYDIYELAKYFSNKYNANSDVFIDKLNNVILDGKKFLFDDTINFLNKLKQKSHKLYMLTYCKESLQFQSLKISGSKIANMFDSLFITSKPKYELDIDYTNGIFIDDNPKDLIGLYNKNPKDLIRIRRPENKYSVKEIENIKIKEFKNLSEFN